MDETEVKGEEIEDVTILCADIKGSTAFANAHTPSEVVNMLSLLFGSFDKEAARLKVYKVCTIGDEYRAIGCLDANDRNPDKEML